MRQTGPKHVTCERPAKWILSDVISLSPPLTKVGNYDSSVSGTLNIVFLSLNSSGSCYFIPHLEIKKTTTNLYLMGVKYLLHTALQFYRFIQDCLSPKMWFFLLISNYFYSLLEVLPYLMPNNNCPLVLVISIVMAS